MKSQGHNNRKRRSFIPISIFIHLCSDILKWMQVLMVTGLAISGKKPLMHTDSLGIYISLCYGTSKICLLKER